MSIVNGYSREGFADSDWGVILEYLDERDPSEVGFTNVEVSHAWTQDMEETEQLCAAARIPTGMENLEDLLDADLDDMVIARDDYEHHREFAAPFLEQGCRCLSTNRWR